MKTILTQKKILITGGSGFIGSYLARRLVDNHYEVHLIIRKGTDLYRIDDFKNKLVLHKADITNYSSISKAIEIINPSMIVNLATFSNYREQENYEKIYNTSVFGVINLLKALENISFEKLINVGSSSEYGFNNKPMKESDVLSPISFYAGAKVAATHLTQIYGKHFGKQVINVRPFSVYGPFEDRSRLIPTVIRSIIENKIIRLTHGSQKRDFIFVEDIVDALIAIIECKKNLSNEVFNIGTGREYSNDEVVRCLFKISGKKTKIVKGAFPKRIWDSNHWVANTTHSKRVLNWKAKTSLEEGLTKTYNWVLNSTDEKRTGN